VPLLLIPLEGFRQYMAMRVDCAPRTSNPSQVQHI